MTVASEMIARALEGFRSEGKLDVSELDQILGLAMEDGVMDEGEKKALINILFNLTSSDLTPELWAKVEQLIQQFELDK
jgi:hypothetical protein